ncbi:MAG: EsaB/YukD family protein [Bacillus sp. (in: firmicutes)]
MYIGITVDLKNYTGEVFDLRISNFLTIRKVIDICWKVKEIEDVPAEGCWIRVVNKEKICSGYETLLDSGITSGDRIEIL